MSWWGTFIVRRPEVKIASTDRPQLRIYFCFCCDGGALTGIVRQMDSRSRRFGFVTELRATSEFRSSPACSQRNWSCSNLIRKQTNQPLMVVTVQVFKLQFISLESDFNHTLQIKMGVTSMTPPTTFWSSEKAAPPSSYWQCLTLPPEWWIIHIWLKGRGLELILVTGVHLAVSQRGSTLSPP